MRRGAKREGITKENSRVWSSSQTWAVGGGFGYHSLLPVPFSPEPLTPLPLADNLRHPEAPRHPQLWVPRVMAPEKTETQRGPEIFCKPARCGTDASGGWGGGEGAKGMETDA